MEEVKLRKYASTFQDLVVWQKAHAFVLHYVTKQFPEDERFGLTSQFRRAAVSISANIAEGFRKQSKSDKARFFNIAEGSLEECRYYLILARDLSYLDKMALWADSEEIARLLNAYRTAILRSIA